MSERSNLGEPSAPIIHELTPRWLMAYMACLSERELDYFDSSKAIQAHPLFPVCLEWPVIVSLRSEPITQSNATGAVHASHDLHIHHPLTSGVTTSTKAQIIGREQKKPGVYETLRMDTTDTSGTLLCTTYQGSMILGARMEEAADAIEVPPEIPGVESLESPRIYPQRVGSGFAHIYTECARI